MTLLPRLDEVGDAVIVTLDNGTSHVLHTPMQARQHGDQYRVAEQRLTEQQMARAAELDRAAARSMNEAHAPEHVEWGRTLAAPAPVVPIRVVHACGCSRTERCEACDPAGGAA